MERSAGLRGATALVPVVLPSSRGGDFFASLRSNMLCDLSLTEIGCRAQGPQRLSAPGPAAGRPDIVLFLQRAGSILMEQDGRRALVLPGWFAFHDSSRPVLLEASGDCRALCVRFPVAWCPDGAPALQQATACALDGALGLGPAVFQLLDSLCRASVPPRNPGRVARHAVGLLEQLLTEQIGQFRDADAPEELLEKCLAYIDAHLADPELGPRQVAAANFISTRYLHVLFRRTSGTVAAHIRQLRLQRIREDLEDPRLRAASVESIVRHRGVANVSHFGQAFRKATGKTPAAYRRSVLHPAGADPVEAAG